MGEVLGLSSLPIGWYISGFHKVLIFEDEDWTVVEEVRQSQSQPYLPSPNARHSLAASCHVINFFHSDEVLKVSQQPSQTLFAF